MRLFRSKVELLIQVSIVIVVVILLYINVTPTLTRDSSNQHQPGDHHVVDDFRQVLRHVHHEQVKLIATMSRLKSMIPPDNKDEVARRVNQMSMALELGMDVLETYGADEDKSIPFDRLTIGDLIIRNTSINDTVPAVENKSLKNLHEHVKVLCLIPCSDDHFRKMAETIKDTWGKRCNKLLFFSNNDIEGAIGLHMNETGNYDLANKVLKGFYVVYKEHLNGYDWFLKADMDTYMIMENLRLMLSKLDPEKPSLLGHEFNQSANDVYMSGGAGYVMSRAALRLFGDKGYGTPACTNQPYAEDWAMSYCLQKLGVQLEDSRDALGHQRFHPFRHNYHLSNVLFPRWYYKISKYPAQSGIHNMSDLAVSFHSYYTKADFYNVDYLLYHLRPYGVPHTDEHN